MDLPLLDTSINIWPSIYRWIFQEINNPAIGVPHDYGNLRMDVLGIFHDLPIKNVDFP